MKNQTKTIVFLVFALFFAFFSTHAQVKTLKNIGFIQNNIWYSKDLFFEGDKVRIYTMIFNGSSYDFRGSLEFFASGKSIGKSNFSLVNGAFQVLWTDWIAEGGNKKVYANIVESRISLPGGVEEVVVLENAKTGEVEIFVDKDTDKDGVGDKVDIDDDNDNILDAEETKKGTNPLVKNTISTSAVFQKIEEKTDKKIIPEPKEIAESAQGIIASVNEFLDEQKEKVKTKKEKLKKKLEEGESLFEFDFGNFFGKKEERKEGIVDEKKKENKNFLKLYLLGLSALIFSLEYKAIIYLLGIYLAYRVLKFFIKRIFFRHVDN